MQAAAQKELQAIYEQIQAQLAVLKDFQTKKSKQIDSRQQLDAQRSENELVKEELGNLDGDAGVYKLIGPVLVSQDQADAKMIVDKRLDYINSELKRVDAAIDVLDKQEDDTRGKVMDLQRKIQERAAQLQQQAAAAAQQVGGGGQ
jgi:prefoldin beta subunit